MVSDRCSLIIFTEETLLLGREKPPYFGKFVNLLLLWKEFLVAFGAPLFSGFSSVVRPSSCAVMD